MNHEGTPPIRIRMVHDVGDLLLQSPMLYNADSLALPGTLYRYLRDWSWFWVSVG